MTKKKFLNRTTKSKTDVVQILLNALRKSRIKYCVIGGLAVNAYTEPVVSLDLDLVIAAEKMDKICHSLENDFKIATFPHSINLSRPDSGLRIQIQTDPRYQEFIGNACQRSVLGYRMNVAAIEDVLKGKIWAYQDKTRRQSKRQKDLADILRLGESHPEIKKVLPFAIRKFFE